MPCNSPGIFDAHFCQREQIPAAKAARKNGLKSSTVKRCTSCGRHTGCEDTLSYPPPTFENNHGESTFQL